MQLKHPPGFVLARARGLGRFVGSVVVVGATAAIPVAISSIASCRVFDPPARPEGTCSKACESKATQCSSHACLRGCTLAMDRVLERETDAVIACVAKNRAACDDAVWAKCAVRVGAYADGGPPAPPSAKDYEAEEEAPAPKKNRDDDLLD